MLVFIDLDGVTHPAGPDKDLFCRVELLWQILRACPDVEVVFSTSWRDSYKFEELVEFVTYGGGEDLEHRFIGTTPSIVREQIANITGAGRREQECRLWLSGNGQQQRSWIALDDTAVFFTTDCPMLYLVDKTTGLTEADVTKLIARINQCTCF